MPGVHFSSNTNSTKFTDCCNTAILDDEKDCPHCGVEILPRNPRERWNMAERRMGLYKNIAIPDLIQPKEEG